MQLVIDKKQEAFNITSTAVDGLSVVTGASSQTTARTIVLSQPSFHKLLKVTHV